MNRLARIIIILGAGIIIALLILLYFASQRMLQEVESRLNQSMSIAKVQVNDSHSSDYGIQSFDYAPFRCSGLMNYTCHTDYIAFYMQDPLSDDKSSYEKIRFVNFTLNSKDIKSRNYLSFTIQTDIEYPDSNKFFGDSKQDPLIAFLNHSADALLPNNLSCNQNYNYDYREDLKRTVITADTKCDFVTQLFTGKIGSVNLFAPDVERSHILGILYEIAMAINGDLNREELLAHNIPHELLSIDLSIYPKKSFKDFLLKYDWLSEDQKAILQTQFDGNVGLIKFFGIPFLHKYLGKDGIKLGQALIDLAYSELNKMNIALDLKTEPKFQPIKVFKDRSIVEWLTYFKDNYNITIIADKKTLEDLDKQEIQQEEKKD